MFWILKISIQIPYFVLTKRFQNPKLCQNKSLFGVKNNFQKKNGVLKRFSSLNFLPLKLLASFKCFENLTPISNALRKGASNPFVCVLNFFWEKHFSFKYRLKKRGFMKTYFSKLLQNALHIVEVFVFFS